MFRSFDPYAEEETPFGFGAPSPHAPAGQPLIGVKTQLGWARPRWTASGSMWLEGEDFSLPLNRFAPGTLEPVFETQPGRGGAPSIQPTAAPGPGRGAPMRPLRDHRLFDAVDTHLGRATPHWGEDASLSLEIDGVRRPLHHFAADEIKAVHEPGDKDRLYGSFGSDALAGSRGEDDPLGRETSGLAGPSPFQQPQSRSDQSQLRSLASTGPMPWDPTRNGLAESAGRWVRDLLGGVQSGNPQEPVAPEPPERTAPPPLVEGTEVNWGWIDDRERHLGRGDLDGYVPELRKGVPYAGSGVTVAKGVDLGRRSIASLNELNLPPEIVEKLSPYVGLKGRAAAAALRDERGRPKPIGLTPAEAKTVSEAVRRDELSRIAKRYNADSQVGRFEDLPPNAQTVIASVYFQHGSYSMPRTPKFWGAITSGNWPAAYDELMDFGGGFDDRRELEAGLLQEDIKAGRLPAPARKSRR